MRIKTNRNTRNTPVGVQIHHHLFGHSLRVKIGSADTRTQQSPTSLQPKASNTYTEIRFEFGHNYYGPQPHRFFWLLQGSQIVNQNIPELNLQFVE